MRHAAEQTAANLFSLGFYASIGSINCQLIAFKCQCQLTCTRFKKTALIGSKQTGRIGHTNGQTPQRAMGSDQWQEQRNCAGQSVGTGASNLLMLCDPLGRW